MTILPGPRSFQRLSAWMLGAERYGVEVFLAACSLWAAVRLLTPPSNFDAYEAVYYVLRGIQAHETRWGLLAATGSILQVLGLSLSVIPFRTDVASALRCAGLAISGIIWSVLGLSFLIGNPDSLTAVPMILMGCAAWWTLLRFPSVPRRLY